MANIKILIIDENNLELLEDAKKGDTINLLDNTKVDSSKLSLKIQEKLKEEIAFELSKQVKELQNQQEILISKIESENQLKTSKLLLAKEEELKEQIKKFEEEINSYRLQNEKLKLNLESNQKEIDDKVSLKVKEEELKLSEKFKKTEIELNNLVSTLKEELNGKDREKVFELEKLRTHLENEFKEQLNKKENEISLLKQERMSVQTKVLGEELETFCKNEYDNYYNSGAYENCTFEKDTKSVKTSLDDTKGTKGDFIFRVYPKNNKTDGPIISVMCEMKTSAYSSTSSLNKNANHYKKLDEDAKKKDCQFSLLVSELEISNVNNESPIILVPEYKNMYMCRPAYFMTVINIFKNLAEKYEEIFMSSKEQMKVNASAKEISSNVFEFFNKHIISKLDKLEKELETITNSTNKIQKELANIENANNKMKSIIIDKWKNDFTVENLNDNIVKLEKKIYKL